MQIDSDVLAVVNAIDPIPPHHLTSAGASNAYASLLKIAGDHPRRPAARDVRADPVALRRRVMRRGALAAAAMSACVATGGVAVAATGSWSEVSAAWAHLTGRSGSYSASAPRLVGRGLDVDGTPVELFVAPNKQGGQCVSIRGTGRLKGFTLDSCGGASDSLKGYGLDRAPSYQVRWSTGSQFVYGRANPKRVKYVTLSVPKRNTVKMQVNGSSGYWLGAFTGDASRVKLSNISTDGTTLGVERLRSSAR